MSRAAQDRKRMILKICLYLAIAAIGLVVLHGCANRAFYVPFRQSPVPPLLDETSPYRIESVRIPSDGGEMDTWVLEPAIEEASGTVVYCHGNAGNIQYHLPFVDFLPLHGYRVVLFDYRGYGDSTAGGPTRDTTVADVHAALDYARSKYGKPWLMGQSLGASLAIWVGAERKEEIHGVVGIASFTGYRSIARQVIGGTVILWPLKWPLGLLVSKGFDPIDAIDRVSPTPLLLVHGEEDDIIPPRMSRELYEKAHEPKDLLIVPGVGHNDDWQTYGPEYVRRVVGFLKDTRQ